MKTIAVMLICLLLPAAASAIKLYKWVDKDGKVTYQETPPPAGDGRVEEKLIDPNTNVIQAEHAAPPPDTTRRRNEDRGQRDFRHAVKPPADTPPAPILQEDSTGGQTSGPFPARQPPPVPTTAPALAPLPAPTPPPAPSLPAPPPLRGGF